MNHSPRDLLLGRHADAEARLDALRRAALPEAPLGWCAALRELFYPNRAVWTALAAVWAVVALVAALSAPPASSASDTSPPMVRKAYPELYLTQQEQIYALLAQMDPAS